MKKTSKILAIAASFIFTAITGMSADAVDISYEIKAPDGYTEITESTGYACIDNETSSFFLRENEDGTADAVKYEFFNHNYTVFKVPNDNIAAFDEIYEKYDERLNMSQIMRTKNCIDDSTQEKYMEVVIYDNFVKDGKVLKDNSAGENKYELIKEMISELYSANSLIEAEYKGTVALKSKGTYDGNTNIITDDSVTQEEIDNILVGIGVKTADSWYNEKNHTIRYSCPISISIFDKLEDTVISEYPDAQIMPRLVFEGTTSRIYFGSVNLLDPYICDIDGDGNADITDATAILSSYAENAAGIQKAAESDPMDVNGDGTVDLQDATYVLTYYAESAAGLR